MLAKFAANACMAGNIYKWSIVLAEPKKAADNFWLLISADISINLKIPEKGCLLVITPARKGFMISNFVLIYFKTFLVNISKHIVNMSEKPWGSWQYPCFYPIWSLVISPTRLW